MTLLFGPVKSTKIPVFTGIFVVNAGSNRFRKFNLTAENAELRGELQRKINFPLRDPAFSAAIINSDLYSPHS